MSDEGNNTFMRITNKDIYNELLSIKTELKNNNYLIDERFNKIDLRINRNDTKIRINSWVSKTAFSLIILVITALLKFVVKG